MLRAAWPVHGKDAGIAYDLFDSWCASRMARVPGIGTVERLAIRLANGKTIEQATSAEYLYRWALAIKPADQCRGRATSVFGTPHAIGL